MLRESLQSFDYVSLHIFYYVTLLRILGQVNGPYVPRFSNLPLFCRTWLGSMHNVHIALQVIVLMLHTILLTDLANWPTQYV